MPSLRVEWEKPKEATNWGFQQKALKEGKLGNRINLEFTSVSRGYGVLAGT